MEVISVEAPKVTQYVGTCECGCVAKFERSEATENTPVVGGLSYGLIVKCPNCADGMLYSPYKVFEPNQPV